MSNRVLPTTRVCTLGAINGLVFGIIASVAQDIYVTRLLNRTGDHLVADGSIIDMANPIPLSYGLVIIISMLAFAGVTQLFHKYWKFSSSLLLLWVIIGIAATAVLMIGIRLIELFSLNHPELNHFSLWGILLVLVVVINFIYGLVIQTSTELYSRDSD